MYPVDRVMSALYKWIPEVDEKTARMIYDAMQKERRVNEDWTKDHPGYCTCPPCEWLNPMPEQERWHGTTNGYQYHKCRCERCRKAARQYNRGRR